MVGGMTYERLGDSALDYFPCRYGTSKLLFRGPRRKLDGAYCAVLGGTETYGKFILQPYAALVEAATGITMVNFGCVNAGADVFVNDPAVIDACVKARATVVQVTGAHNTSNRFYAVHPRRNDRFLRASTLLKAISGLIQPSQGSITFDGQRIDGMRPDLIVRQGLVQVTQGKESYPAMTVEENLRLGAYIVSDRAKARRALDRVFTYFPILKDKRSQLSGTLSGGQLQMLCIGRGLMSEPKMIMLDEPSAALAPQIVLDIFRTIHRISRDGMTVLMVEQNVRMALLLAGYGYVIKDGVIHIEGPSEQLIHDDNVRLSYLGGTVADRDAGLSMRR